MGRTHFLKGVVTGSEWLKFGFITSGFNRICGPPDDRLGRVVIGGGATDGITGGGEETGIEGIGVWLCGWLGTWLCIGDWYISWGGDIRKGLAGVGETDEMGDIGAPMP